MQSSLAGYHLLMDAVLPDGVDVTPLRDTASIENFLIRLIQCIGMTPLDEPVSYEVEENPEMLRTDEDEGGVTAFCVLTTSHVSIHTWPLRRRFSMDVFSCAEFDFEDVCEFVRDEFGVGEVAVQKILRHWPQ